MAQLRKLYARVDDTSGNPVSGASVYVLRHGATVESAIDASNLELDSAGDLRNGDLFEVIRSGSPVSGYTGSLTDEVRYDSSNRWAAAYSDSAGSWTPADGDIVVLKYGTSAHRVSLYADSRGTDTKTNPLTSSNSGVIEAYVDASEVDLVVDNGGEITYITDIPTSEFNNLTVEGDTSVVSAGAAENLFLSRVIPAGWWRYGRGFRIEAWGTATDGGASDTKTITIDILNNSTGYTLSTMQIAAGADSDWRIESTVIRAKEDSDGVFISSKGWEDDAIQTTAFNIATSQAINTTNFASTVRVRGTIANASSSLTMEGCVFELLEGDT